jgi:hypothetical protein
MDPAHIAPSRSDTNSNGHFPLNNNHGQGGTPRGFNLSNLQQFNLPPMPGGMPNAMQMAAFLAQGGMNPSWNGSHQPFGVVDDERHAGGPMRRTNNRFTNNRAAGPYDRPNKDNRTARWNLPGRLTPPRNGGGRAAGPPRFADGAAASVGPREAVQGRSLKSYEDLDAAGGDGTGALDY